MTMGILNNFSIKYKIGVSFLLVICAMAIQAVLNNRVQQNVSASVNRVIEDVQPPVVASMEIYEVLNSDSASLGFYLLSKELTLEQKRERRKRRKLFKMKRKVRNRMALNMNGSTKADTKAPAPKAAKKKIK